MALEPLAIPKWGGRRASEALDRVRTIGARNGTPCAVCHGRIDYRLRYPDPWSCSVQHIPSRAVAPERTWDPAAMFPAHLQCNKEAGDGTAINPYDLGFT